jgi:hypothetical protein
VAGSIDLGSRAEILGRATVELFDVAASLDRLYDCTSHSVELIEATRAIHVALNAVSALSASLSDVQSSWPRGQAASLGRADVRARFEVKSWARGPGSAPISILYDDLLEPIRSATTGEKEPWTSTGEARND